MEEAVDTTDLYLQARPFIECRSQREEKNLGRKGCPWSVLGEKEEGEGTKSTPPQYQFLTGNPNYQTAAPGEGPRKCLLCGSLDHMKKQCPRYGVCKYNALSIEVNVANLESKTSVMADRA